MKVTQQVVQHDATYHISTAAKNIANGVAGLDASILLNLSQQRLNFKIGYYYYDTSTASGNVSTTGVGFQPRGVIILAQVVDTPQVSVGMDNGSNGECVANEHSQLANAWVYNTTYSIYLIQGAGISTAGRITSFDADGFTIAYTKTGAKTGAAGIMYLAYR